MVVYDRYVHPQSCQRTWKFAKLWRINFSLENLNSLVVTCLKPEQYGLVLVVSYKDSQTMTFQILKQTSFLTLFSRWVSAAVGMKR